MMCKRRGDRRRGGETVEEDEGNEEGLNGERRKKEVE